MNCKHCGKKIQEDDLGYMYCPECEITYSQLDENGSKYISILTAMLILPILLVIVFYLVKHFYPDVL